MNLKYILRLHLVMCVFAFMQIQTGFAQHTYQPLKSVGEIPEEFRTLTAAKVQKAKAEDKSNKTTKQERRHINDFLLRNNYMIDELLTSGKILFGDPLTEYINEVAAMLLEDEPDL